MAITPQTNPNFEKVGSIRILSAANVTRAEQEGFIFGGLGYSANIDVNDGNGYSITINVVSKNGEYSISESDLNATSAGAKNIQIGNFVFYDFFLVSYSIQKQVENSILVLTYKDKSIFMDKVYVGLLHHEHGIGLIKDPKGTQELRPTSITTFNQGIQFEYKCDKADQTAKPTKISLQRDLYTVFTSRNPTTEFEKFSLQQRNSILNLVNSPYFYSRYDYVKNGVNGGFIILGSEEFKESPCSIRDTSYTFRDLLSALFYSKIPGIANITLPKNAIFKTLRKNYFGSLRDVLSNWASDIGIRFYYQPKIQYRVRDYNDLNTLPSNNYKTIEEGLKYLDPNSGPESLKRLNTFLRSNDGKILKKVIQNINETASLEGTVKSSVITSIRREARVFPKSIENVFTRSSAPLGLENIPAFYGVNPTTDEFLIRATLGKYDEELRDIYALNNISINNNNAASMGILEYKSLFTDYTITNTLDFLALFGEELGSASTVLDNYQAYLVRYDPARHEAIKNWERAVMDEFYNQYYKISLNTEQQQFCGDTSNFNIQYNTEPPSQRYSANELPFKNLLYNKSQLTFLDATQKYNKNKTSPLFTASNPFDDRNETTFQNFISQFSNNSYSTKKSLKIIDLYSNASARNALLMCLGTKNFSTVFNFLNQPNVYVIVCPSLSSGDFMSTISLVKNDPSIVNLSVLKADEIEKDNQGSKAQCKTTICEQSIDDIGCRDPNSSKSIYTGFIGNPVAKAVRLTKNSNFDLILPTDCSYRYAVTRQIDSTTTFPAQNYVLGSLPEFPSAPKANTSEYNVLSYSCVRNPVPEILTQISSEAGVQDQIITFDDDNKPGERAVITNALTFHDVASKQINNSIVEPFQTKSFSLTSTYVPKQLEDYIFNNPILSSMSFQLGQDGFNMSFNFQSRPKQPKALDSVFQTQQFLQVL